MKYSTLAAACLLGSIALLTIQPARHATASARPPNVPISNWIDISENVGFVVLPIDPRTIQEYPANRVQMAFGMPLQGYFVAKTSKGWVRLVAVDPPIIPR